MRSKMISLAPAPAPSIHSFVQRGRKALREHSEALMRVVFFNAFLNASHRFSKFLSCMHIVTSGRGFVPGWKWSRGLLKALIVSYSMQKRSHCCT